MPPSARVFHSAAVVTGATRVNDFSDRRDRVTESVGTELTLPHPTSVRLALTDPGHILIATRENASALRGAALQ